jgi:uncharacterized protein (TIGR01777 family)
MPETSQKLVLAGGSGFLGRLLVDWFHRSNWEVVVLTRQRSGKAGPARAVAWDGRTLGDWARELDGSSTLVNLAGQSVNCRYHARNREAILASRVDSTHALGQAVQACVRPPKVWLNSSTATIYKHSYDRPMDEASGLVAGSPEAKDVFSVDVAKAWEQAFEEAVAPETRKVVLRTAMVFSTHRGTVYRVLRRLVRCGLGGAMGSGSQYVSWLHQTDLCRAIEWLMDRDDFVGAVNLAAPQPLSNREMMRIIRAVCHMPIGLPAKRWMLEIGALVLRTETELIIKSRRVVPARLADAGFQFRFPDLASAVEDLERRLALAVC